MVEFAAPQFTEKHPTTENLWMDCPKSLEVRTEKSNAYEAIFVQELKRFMQDSKMIGVYHFNAITNRNYRKVICTTKIDCPNKFSHYSKSQIFVQKFNVDIFTSFSPQIFLTIFS